MGILFQERWRQGNAPQDHEAALKLNTKFAALCAARKSPALLENLIGINVSKKKSDLGLRRWGIAWEYCAKREGRKARPLRTMRPPSCSILSLPRSALPENLICAARESDRYKCKEKKVGF